MRVNGVSPRRKSKRVSYERSLVRPARHLQSIYRRALEAGGWAACEDDFSNPLEA